MLYRRGLVVLLAVGAIALAGCFFIANILPEAIFTVDDPNVNSGVPVSFDASDSNDPDGTIVSYFWDFDDGQTDSTAIFPFTHAFTVQTDPEVFRVTLTVTDNAGGTDSAWKDITVTPTP
ncbi:MAG: PKD domain-containing protein [Candidatus Bipolaricaulis sp.]|nr:PKD domain-containing protein [Candidatus Bipolaricaulis sp.]